MVGWVRGGCTIGYRFYLAGAGEGAPRWSGRIEQGRKRGMPEEYLGGRVVKADWNVRQDLFPGTLWKKIGCGGYPALGLAWLGRLAARRET